MGTKDIIPFQFKPGQSGNPNGARGRAHRRSAVKDISSECLGRIAEALFDGTAGDLEKLAKSDDVTPVERLVIGVIVAAMHGGDARAMEILLNRFVGPVTAAEKEIKSSEKCRCGEIEAMTRAELTRAHIELAWIQIEDETLPLEVRNAHRIINEYEKLELAELEQQEAQSDLC